MTDPKLAPKPLSRIAAEKQVDDQRREEHHYHLVRADLERKLKAAEKALQWINQKFHEYVGAQGSQSSDSARLVQSTWDELERAIENPQKALADYKASQAGPRCPECGGIVVLRRLGFNGPICAVQCPTCLPYRGYWEIWSASDFIKFFTGNQPKEDEPQHQCTGEARCRCFEVSGNQPKEGDGQ